MKRKKLWMTTWDNNPGRVQCLYCTLRLRALFKSTLRQRFIIIIFDPAKLGFQYLTCLIKKIENWIEDALEVQVTKMKNWILFAINRDEIAKHRLRHFQIFQNAFFICNKLSFLYLISFSHPPMTFYITSFIFWILNQTISIHKSQHQIQTLKLQFL